MCTCLCVYILVGLHWRFGFPAFSPVCKWTSPSLLLVFLCGNVVAVSKHVSRIVSMTFPVSFRWLFLPFVTKEKIRNACRFDLAATTSETKKKKGFSSKGKSTFDLLFKFGAVKVKRKWLCDGVQGAVLSDMRAIKTLFIIFFFIPRYFIFSNEPIRKETEERTSRHFKSGLKSSRQRPLTDTKYYPPTPVLFVFRKIYFPKCFFLPPFFFKNFCFKQTLPPSWKKKNLTKCASVGNAVGPS